MSKLNHLDLPEYPSFVTTRTAGSKTLFTRSDLADVLINALFFGREKGWYYLISFVIMPDHLHLIIVPRSRSLSDIIRSLKGYSTKKINEKIGQKGPVWETGFYDYLLDSREKVLSRIRYIEENPVKADLVDNPGDYPYSGVNYQDELDYGEYL